MTPGSPCRVRRRCTRSKKRLGGGENSAPQTPHLLFLDTGKRGELRSQPNNGVAPESAGVGGAALPIRSVRCEGQLRGQDTSGTCRPRRPRLGFAGMFRTLLKRLTTKTTPPGGFLACA